MGYQLKYSKSYKRDLDGKSVKTYRKKNPFGAATLASNLLQGEIMTRAKDMWAKGRKSKFAGKLKNKRGRRNPEEPISPEVEDISKEWHGRGNKYVTDVEELETYQEDLAELADLEELGVLGADLKS